MRTSAWSCCAAITDYCLLITDHCALFAFMELRCVDSGEEAAGQAIVQCKQTLCMRIAIQVNALPIALGGFVVACVLGDGQPAARMWKRIGKRFQSFLEPVEY